MQKITPFLWFDGKAEEAMNFYRCSRCRLPGWASVPWTPEGCQQLGKPVVARSHACSMGDLRTTSRAARDS